MTVDFYVGTDWVDCCDSSQFDPQRLLAILRSKFGNVQMVERSKVAYVKGASLDFSEWLLSI